MSKRHYRGRGKKRESTVIYFNGVSISPARNGGLTMAFPLDPNRDYVKNPERVSVRLDGISVGSQTMFIATEIRRDI